MDSKIRGYIFDYGGTLDTGGQHWARVIWKAWQGHGMPVSEQRFREAYVFAERTLDRNPIVLPTYTFKKLLDVKLRLQMEYLFTHRWWTADKKEFTRVHLDILEGLYADVRRQVAQSRLVLQELRERCPLVLVSNFYGNMGSVLFEMSLDGLFSHVVESAVVGFRKPDPRLFQLAIDAFSQTETTALELRDQELVCAGSGGLLHIRFGALVLAMGCRERPRGALAGLPDYVAQGRGMVGRTCRRVASHTRHYRASAVAEALNRFRPLARRQ